MFNKLSSRLGRIVRSVPRFGRPYAPYAPYVLGTPSQSLQQHGVTQPRWTDALPLRGTIVVSVSGSLPFDFRGDRNKVIRATRGHHAMVLTISWRQGRPLINNFSLSDIDLVFYSDAGRTSRITSSSDNYYIGDEMLDEIITLENFVDNGDNTGSVDIRVDPSDITAEELMANRNIYIALQVDQPIQSQPYV